MLDEPSASLDPANVERLISNVKTAISEEGVNYHCNAQPG